MVVCHSAMVRFVVPIFATKPVELAMIYTNALRQTLVPIDAAKSIVTRIVLKRNAEMTDVEVFAADVQLLLCA